MPDKIVYDLMTGKFLDPLTVEKGRLRELNLVSKHKTHELVEDAGPRGGARKWLLTTRGNMVKTHFAVSETQSVVQSILPLTVSTLLMKVSRPWMCTRFEEQCLSVRAMNGSRALMAWNGLAEHKLLRDGATTVEVVSTTKHNPCHVVKTHYDDLFAASTRQGLSLLSSTLANNIRTEVLERLAATREQACSPVQRWSSLMELTGGSPNPGYMQERTEDFARPVARHHGSLARKTLGITSRMRRTSRGKRSRRFQRLAGNEFCRG